MSQAAEILAKAAEGVRICPEEAVVLLREGNLLEIGVAANAVRNRKNSPATASYIIDRNINYTNVCVYRCKFCAFYRPEGASDTYVLSWDEIGKKIEETIELGGTGILLQGGVHAKLPFSFYEEMFRFIRKNFPTIHLHALSAPEVYFLQKLTKSPMRDLIARLRDAGLASIPGGGAEILEDSIRRKILALAKAPVDKWVEVHESAHSLGMRTTATMMFGVGESLEQRVDHLRVVRDLQDRTGGFTAWIPWTFQEENTALMGCVRLAGGHEYLKTLAVSRLFFDNIAHVQGSWVTQGPKIGQTSLSFGADDLGSIMIEENVVAAAGARHRMGKEDMERIISDAGYQPFQRRTLYDACHAPCCRAPIPVPRKQGLRPSLPLAPKDPSRDIEDDVASA